MEELNRNFNLVLSRAGLLTRSPRFRYWTLKKNNRNYAFGWTTEKDGKNKFWAFIYHILINGSWKLVKKVAFGRRRIAKARAYKWYEKMKGGKNG